MSNSDKTLFTQHEHALEHQDLCPDCGSKLSIKKGKSGSFLGCVNYPTCQYTRPLVEQERIEDKVLVGSECPLCSNPLAVKQGRYGMFIGCTHYPQCPHIEETHQHDDVGVACPQCHKKGNSGELFEKTNRYGKTFYSCDQYPKCKYVINHAPVNEVCPECQWPILIKRNMASGEVLMCPEKKCNFKRKAL